MSQTPPRSAVVVLGDCGVDVLSVLAEPHRRGAILLGANHMSIGGQAAATAAWLGKIGVSCSLLASVGDDALGQYVKAQTARLGVRTDLIQVQAGGRTSITVRSVDEEGVVTSVVDPGVNDLVALTPAAIEAIAGAEVLIGNLRSYLRPETHDVALHALAAAREADTVVVMDVAEAALIAAAKPKHIRRYLDQVDIILANDEEVSALTADQPKGWLGSLPNLIIKHGPGGASWWSHGEPVARRSAASADVVDTTGAGDAFCAGLVATLALVNEFVEIRGRNKNAALENANAVAGQACRQLGAWPA